MFILKLLTPCIKSKERYFLVVVIPQIKCMLRPHYKNSTLVYNLLVVEVLSLIKVKVIVIFAKNLPKQNLAKLESLQELHLGFGAVKLI